MLIRTDKELDEALKLAAALMSAVPGTPEFDILNDLATEIESYEKATVVWEDEGGKPKS